VRTHVREEEEPLGVIYEHNPTMLEKFLVWLFGSGQGQSEESAPARPSLVPKAPMAPQAPRPAPPPAPISAGPYSASAEVSAEAKERKEILERLKARMATQEPRKPAPALVPPPAPVQAPVTPQAAAPRRAAEPLHTYGRDFGDKVAQDKASAFAVYAADADRGRPAPAGERTKLGALAYLIGAVVLIVGGSLSVYVAYQFLGANAPIDAPASPFAPSLIAADEQTEVSGAGYALMQQVAGAASAPLTIGNVRLLYLTAATTTLTGVENVPQPGGALVRALELPAPDILLRNIRPESTVGVIHAGAETRAFFLLAVSSYERTFAGMLAWEPQMEYDLALLYPAYAVPEPIVAMVSTSSPQATTTPQAEPAPAPVMAQPVFIDEVVESHDVRALKDAYGNTILLYGYRDPYTLIIARDEAAYSAILNRLSATRTQ
jgi:hypothetical protein